MSGRIGISARGVVVQPFDRLSPLEACDIAGRLVRAAGFCLSWVSMKSEACYFVFPGRHGTLRIATHSKGGKNADLRDGPTLVSITFPEGSISKDGKMKVTSEAVENKTANAIGLYLIRAKDRPNPNTTQAPGMTARAHMGGE